VKQGHLVLRRFGLVWWLFISTRGRAIGSALGVWTLLA
jgi:hypothetical protein